MMVLRAAIGGAPLSVGQGQEVPPTHAMLASGLALTFPLRSAGLCLPPRRYPGQCSHPASPRCMSPSGSGGPSRAAHRSRSPAGANAVRAVVSARDPPN